MSKYSRKFTPGAKSLSSRMIRYNAVYNALRENLNNDPTNSVFYYSPSEQQKEIVCNCYDNVAKKFTPDSQGTSPNISNNMRVAQCVRIPRSGKPQFGNFYLGEPLTLNYLGRMEGQPGGGGMPLRNQF
jgi:hypothetical protein